MTRSKPRAILVPTDFSEASTAAKNYAAMLADALGATLHVLHVIPDPLAMGWGVSVARLPQLLEHTEQEVRDELDKAITPDERARLSVQVAVDTGSPAEKILAYAAAQHIDLIVMGTVGRGAIEKMWVGSITQRVLQQATCPVVAVQQPRAR